MTIYLVDYENVNVAGFEGFKKIDSNSKVVIFYSENANTLTFGLHRRLSQNADFIEYMKADISSGKNALDFQLSCYAGLCMHEYPNCEIFIVSKDKGYDSLVKLARKYNCKLSRIENFSNCNEVQKNNFSNLQMDVFNSIKDLNLKEFDSKDLTIKIAEIINTYKSKNTINGHISKIIKDNNLHKDICKAIKPLLKDKS